jgi:predicted deacylase
MPVVGTIERRMVTAAHRDGSLEFPLADIRGAHPGATVAIVTGMHGGEYSGPLAAMRLIQQIDPEVLAGRLLIVPVLSTQAFMMRSMQLSPIDEREVHYVWPGKPQGSYSEALIDLLYGAVKDADYLLDLHSGEMAQALEPYVCVPWVADGALWDASLTLAQAFDVPFVDRRALADTPLALPKVLLDRGIPNVWTEIGRNGLTDPRYTSLQYDGLVNVLRRLQMLPGEYRAFTPRVVGPQHWSVYADRSGVWLPYVGSYDNVSAGQELGELTDYFGQRLEVFSSPADALVEYVASSPAINIDRQPHGYAWHQLLVQMVQDPGPG